jgi:hypothetical protein
MKRAKPDINTAIRQLQKLEAVAQCATYAATEEAEDIDFSDALALIADGLGSTLMTLDEVEASIGREVPNGRK